jgi:hypothetical protein
MWVEELLYPVSSSCSAPPRHARARERERESGGGRRRRQEAEAGGRSQRVVSVTRQPVVSDEG